MLLSYREFLRGRRGEDDPEEVLRWQKEDWTQNREVKKKLETQRNVLVPQNRKPSWLACSILSLKNGCREGGNAYQHGLELRRLAHNTPLSYVYCLPFKIHGTSPGNHSGHQPPPTLYFQDSRARRKPSNRSTFTTFSAFSRTRAPSRVPWKTLSAPAE